MKWWYFLVLAVGMILALLWLNRGIFDHSKNLDNWESNNSEIKGKPTAFVITKKGEKVSVKEIPGVVKNWDYKSAKLTFKEDGVGEKIIEIDPSQMVIMINSLKERGRDLVVTEKNGIRWQSAFCVGDMIVVRIDEDNQPVFLMNNGYRSCGFKGE